MINKGSEWNIWDLHVHTPASGFATDADYPTLIENIKKSEADVIGINDYCSIQGYKKIMSLGGVEGKVLFPVVELRMNNKINHKNSTATDGGVSINFHLIFDNDTNLKQLELELNSLDCKFDGGKDTKLGHIEKVDELNMISFDFFKTIDSLNSSILKGKFLVWVPYDEYGGIDAIDPVNDGFFKLGIINSADILGSGNQKQINYFLSERCITDVGKNIACIKGSDSHQLDYPFGKLRDKDSKPTDRYCWIKGEKSFKALQHLIVEPIDRVLIKEKNPIDDRVNSNRTKYIDSIRVNAVTNYDPNTQGEWFNGVDIPLNPELVAIIGNKGNGKSALADIIGLCGDYRGDHDDFSFLNKKRFGEHNGRKSSNFEATLVWKSGHSVTKNLNDKVDESSTEKVKYLPQGYFERLTNNHDSVEDFNKEIENVVFTHLDETEKLGKRSFKELIDYRTKVTEEEIVNLKTKLQIINKSIFEKEKKLNPEYKKSLLDNLSQKQQELTALIEPVEVANPNEDPAHAKANQIVNERLLDLNNKIEEANIELQKTKERKSNLLIELNNLKEIKKRIENKVREFENFKEEIKVDLSKYALEVESLLAITCNLEGLDTLIQSKDVEYTKLNALLGEENSQDSTFKSIPQKLEELKLEQSKIQNDLGEADKKYQKYLSDKKYWEDNKTKIIGTATTLGSLEFYKYELKYVDEKLLSEIEVERNARLELTKQIFELKESVLLIYKSVKEKIDNIISENEHLLSAYPIKVVASFSLKPNFQKRFLDYISLNKIGTFYGKENAEIQLRL